jgi:hypothetical protein
VRATIFITFEGIDHPVPIQLRAGIEVDNSLLPELHHPASMMSYVASEFETREGMLHYDGYDVPLDAMAGGPGPYRIKRLEIEQTVGVPGALVVAGATALVRAEPRATASSCSSAARCRPRSANGCAARASTRAAARPPTRRRSPRRCGPAAASSPAPRPR